jgi:DNA-binding transcriptional LysR family regulator
MNTLHLKYAVEVEKTGSIVKAAKNLYMNQPHLSKAIRELEETVGIIIFNRTSKGVVPTKKGGEFLIYAKDILSQIEAMENLYKSDGDSKLKFNVAVPRASYISAAFIEFMKTINLDDDIDVDYRETNSLRTIKNIANCENNLGVIRFQAIYEKYFVNLLEEKDLKYDTIWAFEYVVLMSKEHPLANEKEIDCSSLNQYIEITHGDLTIPSLPLSKVKQMKRTDDKKKKIAVYERGSQFELLRHIPSCYMWVSPMPEETMKSFSLVQKRCEFAQNRHKDLLIYRKGYPLTDRDKTFIQILKKTVEEVALN